MIMAHKLKIGVVGVGFGAQVHIPAFQSEGLDVIAVAARREERAKETAEKFDIPNFFSDYELMLELNDLDAVSIATPVHLHLPIVLAALKAGKHVICEKPFSTDQATAKEMLNAANESKKTAMIAHEFRFSSGRSRVKELIDEGHIGELQMALVTLVTGPRRPIKPRPLTDRDVAENGGGFLFGLGSHYIDALRQWFGEISSVSGTTRTHYPDRINEETGNIVQSNADDTFQFRVEFASGGWATMVASSAAPYGPGGRMEVYGTDGTLITPHVGPGMNPPAHGKILAAKLGQESLNEETIPDRLQPFEDDRDDRLMPFRLLTREFLRGIDEGISPAPNFYDGYRCQQILDGIRESSLTGNEVQIEL
ncbi:MAG: Gfo/Idh/MocA family oxidoreductase [SAR202 cluster bacterium]|nr:Gfo/Idh/MocA family oxidoreductase [SAR202 cluster bacterium]|tara:strand:- start:15997 stop:17094 length:1098 start_codon:yes stop_codon:yes gene_type:complete